MATRKLKLSFKDSKDYSKMITVDYPKDSIENDEISQAMDEIITTNVLKAKDGLIIAKSKAYEEVVNRNNYELN